VGFVAGLVLGGILMTVVGWRAVLWVNVPIGIVTVVLGRMSRPADRRGRAGGRAAGSATMCGRNTVLTV
jgi:MFS family permease